jgi:hypothetical protein
MAATTSNSPGAIPLACRTRKLAGVIVLVTVPPPGGHGGWRPPPQEGGDSTRRGAGAELDVGGGHGCAHATDGEFERERRGVLVEFSASNEPNRGFESVCGTSS